MDKQHPTYDDQGRLRLMPMDRLPSALASSPTSVRINLGPDGFPPGLSRMPFSIDLNAVTNPVPADSEFIKRICDEIEGTPPSQPLVKLANGNIVTPEQVNEWNGREFGTGLACGLAVGAAILSLAWVAFGW